MAAVVSRIFKNKLFKNERLLRCANILKTCKLSIQIPPLKNVFKNERSLSSKNFLNNSKLSTNVQPIEKDENKVMIDPLQHPDYFGVHKLFTVEDLFNARVHLGHKEGSLDPRMKPFLYGSRLGHLIFDLDQTAELLRSALNFAAHIAYRSGIILFISRKPQTSHLVEKTAMECGEYSHTRHWKGGILTNSEHEFKIRTRLPDLIILLYTKGNNGKEHIAVNSAAKMCIPSIAIVDTNCNPNLITYPVPGNDDTPCAIELYCKLFKQAILIGKEYRDLELKNKENQEKNNEYKKTNNNENKETNYNENKETNTI